MALAGRRRTFMSAIRRRPFAALVLLLLAQPAATERPHFAGGDLENPHVWRSLLAWAIERQIVLLTTNEGGLVNAVGTLLQLRSHGVMATLVHGTSKNVCDAFYESVPDGACAWTTWKPPGIVGAWQPSNYRTVLFVARKYIVQRLAVNEGMGVLQTDTDTVWFVNPFVLFDSPALRSYDVIVQRDNPFANAGVLYVRNARNGTGTAYVVNELLRTLQLFSGETREVLRAVREILPLATDVAPKVDNEQMHLNDIIASAALGRRVWSFSIARLYSAEGQPCDHPACDDKSKLGYAKTMHDVHAISRGVKLELCMHGSGDRSRCATPPARHSALFPGSALTIADPSRSRRGGGLFSGSAAAAAHSSRLLLAPANLFAHLQQYKLIMAEQHSGRCSVLAELRRARGAELGAASGADAWAWEAKRIAPVVAMVHLAALSSAKHQRALVVQALGSWDSRADGAGRRFTEPRLRGRAMRVVTLTNFDLYPLLAAASTSDAQLALARPLLRLAKLTGRRPAPPAIPCAVGAAAPRRAPGAATAWGGARAAARAHTLPDGSQAKVRSSGSELIVPNSDCGDVLPGDASGIPAVGGECLLLSTAQCHDLILSRFELGRLRANLSEAGGPGASGAGETRVPLAALLAEDGASAGDVGGRGGLRSPDARFDTNGLAERVSRMLGASLPTPIITIDGNGAPLSVLDEALGQLPQFGAESVAQLRNDAGSPIAALCRSVTQRGNQKGPRGKLKARAPPSKHLWKG